MDETACRLFYDGTDGILASEPIARAARKGRLAQNVTRGQTRSVVSLVALLCEDSRVQAELPQYIIGNEHVLPATVVIQLRVEGTLLRNVRLLRRKSAWANDALLASIAQHWGRVLASRRAHQQPILLVDACNAHLGRRFLDTCSRWKIWLVYVPARLTWLVQPADTHCVALLKALLRKRFHDTLLANEDGKVRIQDILLHRNEGIRTVLQGRRWKGAFEGYGYAAGQRLVRRGILEVLEWETAPMVPSTLPALRDLEMVFLRKREFPLRKLLACHRAAPGASAPRAGPDVAHASEPIAERGGWNGRLQSSSRLHVPSPEAVAAPGASNCAPGSSSAPPPHQPWLPSALPPRPVPAPLFRRLPVGRPLLPPRRRRSEETSPP